MSDETQLDMFEDEDDNKYTEAEIALSAWLCKQSEIIAKEHAFYMRLLMVGHLQYAAIYTLHMSNPPPLEEVMKVTGLGKTSIYNILKTLRAMEKPGTEMEAIELLAKIYLGYEQP